MTSQNCDVPPYTPPPQYPGWGPPVAAGGNVYAYDQPGMPSNVVVMQQPGPGIVHTHPDPKVEAEYENLMWISICLCFCCSWIIGIFAIVFVIKARNAARLGRMNDAKSYAMCAKGWMVTTAIVGVTVTVLLVLHCMKLAF